MNVAHVVQVVLEVADGTPEPIAEALLLVQVLVVSKAWKPSNIPDDARGMYEGTFPSGMDDELVMEPPEGRIFLVADNLQDKDDARTVLLHEMAHALGLDETEVAGLGL